jgi:uncharacterized membrane protein
MTALHATGDTSLLSASRPASARITIRKIGLPDLNDALRRGFEDWRACRSEVLVLAFIVPVAAVLFGAVSAAPTLLPFLFPICAGLALVGPMLSLWFAALSRSREQGGVPSAETAAAVFDSPRLNTLQSLCFITVVMFLAWLVVAGVVYNATLGQSGPAGGYGFFLSALTTPAGWEMIALGYVTGALFALFALGVGLVSFPLALDRDVTVTQALSAGLQALLRNPVPMLAWGVIVTVLMILGTLPALLGLSVALPVLGHATWHMYRRLVA